MDIVEDIEGNEATLAMKRKIYARSTIRIYLSTKS